ncbi:DUF4238 domain-containing protein [Algoriphagus sp. AGSA1]|uniref:DUF4238 domain-containing protein n=1 Tax=Algoriphagus sp. AGSA1 TaxID=2907213 RepID=UPI001F3D6AEB|nr:DUF4238 domain-containing protein [Algoriphagus sp. AGSA1]MCE7055837.1 DUF4238 domain-containing protein [Algoriphagus sp. AGSA1]
MNGKQITKDNHYLAQSYLKHWQSSKGKVWCYRTLVSHENIPTWNETHVEGTAFFTHLYSRIEKGSVSDEMEHWFGSEFESPVSAVLSKVLKNDILKPDDWRTLVKFLALHDLRTPARLFEYLERGSETTMGVMQNVIDNFPKDLDNFQKRENEATPIEENIYSFPFKVTPKVIEGEESVSLKIETDIGRASWLYTIQHQMRNTSTILNEHRWTILHSSFGQNWFTSDKPVMRLNYHKGKYDFKGGWNSKGTEIIFPLSPQHLLYTKIGAKPPQRGTRLSADKTSSINKLIVEHSFRNVYSKERNNEIGHLKARLVNLEQFNYEKEFWQKWHLEQGKSENYFF